MKNAVGILALVVIGCSILVEPTDDVRCTPDFDECPDGFVCEDGVCREMCIPPGMDEICNRRDDDCDGSVDEGLEAQQETCNAQDDDCDGRVDEGHDANGDGTIDVSESFDKDEDGFNTCGSNCDEPDGSCVIDPERIDCNDTQPVEGSEGGRNINPLAMERCDGTDNDCDGNAFPLGEPNAECRAPRDELCGGGQICEPDRGCIPLDCNSGRPCTACGPREVCLDGRCEPTECDIAACEAMNQWCGAGPECRDKLTNGEECNRDLECISGFCDTAQTTGLTPSAGAAGLCFEACCSDTDCGSGEFCYGPGTGARSCIRPRPGLATGRTAVGSGGAGASCSTGAECRSGRCDGAAGCFAACGQSSECPDACGLTNEGLGCRSGGDFGESCSSGTDCALEVCGAASSCITQSCRSGGSCPSQSGFRSFCDAVAIDTASGLQATLACVYAPTPEGMANNVSHGESCDRDLCVDASDCCIQAFGVCVSTFATGCNTGTCLSGRCTTTCCTDESCPGTDVCRPQSQSIEGGTFFPMYCVPPS